MTRQSLSNPFPGLRQFDQSEADLFFGREDDVDQLLSGMTDHRFVAVVGPSGTGKSSLVRAGLVPALLGGQSAGLGSRWSIVYTRPGAEPIQNLARSLAIADRADGEATDTAAMHEATLRRSSLGLIDASSRELAHAGRILLIVDQFEELFRLQRSDTPDVIAEEHEAYVKLLMQAATSADVQLYVLVTMRSDFLGLCARFLGFTSLINDGLHLVSRMTRPERRDAIVGPIRVAGADVTPRLVDRVLNDAGPEPQNLPLMQHALMRTWESWAERSEGAIDFDDYEATGGIGVALDRHAEDSYGVLPPADRRTVERVFRRLTNRVGPDDFQRAPTSLGELAQLCDSSEADVVRALEPFTEPGTSFVVIGADGTVDISHESLIRNWRRLSRWAIDESHARARYQRLLDSARRHRDREAALLRNPELQRERDWWQLREPTEQWAERYGGDFDIVRRYFRRSVFRHSCRRAAWGGVGAIVAVASAWWIYDYVQRERDEADAARSDLASVGADVAALGEDLRTADLIQSADDAVQQVRAAATEDASTRAVAAGAAREEAASLQKLIDADGSEEEAPDRTAVRLAVNALELASNSLTNLSEGEAIVEVVRAAELLIDEARIQATGQAASSANAIAGAVDSTRESTSDTMPSTNPSSSAPSPTDAGDEVIASVSAEQFVLEEPMELREVDGRLYVASDTAFDGQASFTIDVPSGKYILRAYVDTLGSTNTNSFFVVLNGDYRVVNLEGEETLMVRMEPGFDGEVIGELRADDGVSRTANLETRDVVEWRQIDRPVLGWVNEGFLGGQIWDVFERTTEPPSGFAWDDVSTRCGGDHAVHGCNPLELVLSPGDRITIATREPATRLSEVQVVRIDP